MKKLLVIVGVIVVVYAIARLAPAMYHEEHHVQVLHEIRAHDSSLSYDLMFNRLMDTSELVKVHPFQKGILPFFTQNREGELTSFPCSNCHNQPLAELKAKAGTNAQKAHWNIKLDHAPQNMMTCATCHADANIDQMHSLVGADVGFNESFKVCGQCHSSQYKDWEGGAHGKQLNGWAPPRVAKTCVGCHNPHKPAFPSRFPARYNTQKLQKQN